MLVLCPSVHTLTFGGLLCVCRFFCTHLWHPTKTKITPKLNLMIYHILGWIKKFKIPVVFLGTPVAGLSAPTWRRWSTSTHWAKSSRCVQPAACRRIMIYGSVAAKWAAKDQRKSAPGEGPDEGRRGESILFYPLFVPWWCNPPK